MLIMLLLLLLLDYLWPSQNIIFTSALSRPQRRWLRPRSRRPASRDESARPLTAPGIANWTGADSSSTTATLECLTNRSRVVGGHLTIN